MKSTSHDRELALLPLILTAFLLLFAAVMGALYGWLLGALALGSSPVALVLLWMTREVPAAEDRIAAIDIAHAAELQHA